MDAAGYTYVCLEKNGKKTWVAVTQMKVVVGSKMTFQPGSEMPNFTSKTLNRTFDSIVFSGGPVAAGGRSAGQARAATRRESPAARRSVASLDKTIKVEKAAGPNAYTVAEIYAKRTAAEQEDRWQ